MAWILRLVQTGAEGEDPGTDLMEISRLDGLGDIAKLGLTLSEAKQLPAKCAARDRRREKRGITSSGAARLSCAAMVLEA